MIDPRQQFQEALRAVPLRQFLADDCSIPSQLSMFAIDLEQAVLQRHLALQSLPDALMELYGHQVFKGFVQDTLAQLQRTRIRPRDGKEFFLVHCNPARTLRGGGKGRTNPPLGVDVRRLRNHSCFLDEYNQKWQQCGLQLGYSIQLDQEEHFCSCNPFPFGQYHTTIATIQHRDQRWSDPDDLAHVVSSVIELASRLSGWAVLYNGSRSAGASIPAHRHYQVFKTQLAQQPFPLQQAAAAKAKKVGAAAILPLIGGFDYPITCFRISGTPDSVCKNTAELAAHWRSLGETFSENIVGIAEGSGVSLYYVPRDQYSYAAGFSGAIACLEILGEFIFSGEKEILALGNGTVTYAWLYDVLRAVAPPDAVKLVDSFVVDA